MAKPGLRLRARETGVWLHSIRTSARIAYLLHLSVRVLSSLMSLIWTRFILLAMGPAMNGVFLNFQQVISLGGLGDLGLGAAVSLQTGTHLAPGEQEKLKQFLAAARTVFLGLACAVGGGFLLFSPVLTKGLGFERVPGVGSLPLLCAIGSAGLATVMLSSYVNNLNYGCKTLSWPVIPAFLLSQMALLGHWLLARNHLPLWEQYLPYVVSAILGLGLGFTYLRLSFPGLATILPLRWETGVVLILLERSLWLYLCSLGNKIYSATGQLVIGSAFGAAEVPRYQNNYKVCEIAVFVILTASFVVLPKLTHLMATPGPEARAELIAKLKRLNQFQTALGCCGALGYLAINDFFMTHWLGAGYRAPILWQAAFALNLAVTTSGDASIQITSRCGDRGLRVMGGVIAATGLVNVALAFLSAKLGSMGGVAMAAGVAQSILSLALGAYVCRFLDMPWRPWTIRTWGMPVGVVALATLVRLQVPLDSTPHVLLLTAVYAALGLIILRILGINARTILEEWRNLRSPAR